MAFFNHKQILDLDKIYKINLINSCSGFKSANLLGSVSKEGIPNVAVFSSVTHLGSNPPTLGFILRPTTVPRDTYKNIKENGSFTINHIYEDIIEDAHHTSAKYPIEISEFDKTNFEEEYKDSCYAPFVKGAPLQIRMKFLEEVHIKANGTLLVLAEVEKIYVREEMISNDFFIDLSKGKIATVTGLDGYAVPNSIERHSYQRPKK